MFLFTFFFWTQAYWHRNGLHLPSAIFSLKGKRQAIMHSFSKWDCFGRGRKLVIILIANAIHLTSQRSTLKTETVHLKHNRSIRFMKAFSHGQHIRVDLLLFQTETVCFCPSNFHPLINKTTEQLIRNGGSWIYPYQNRALGFRDISLFTSHRMSCSGGAA